MAEAWNEDRRQPSTDGWDGIERRKNPDGFAINSWQSLMSLLSIGLMAVAGISWGLKLEGRIDKYSDLQSSMRERFLADISTTQAILARGMLPITEVKIASIERRLDEMQKDIDACARKKNIGIPMAEESHDARRDYEH